MIISNAYQDELFSNSWKRSWENVFKFENDILRDTVIWEYSFPKRYYHNISHLIGSLQAFKECTHLMTSPKLVELAIWFHDIVYDTNRLDNELASYHYLEREIEKKLNFPGPGSSLGNISSHEIKEILSTVKDLILATKHNLTFSEGSNDQNFLCDIDLVTLGADDATFTEYCLKLRREYSDVPSEIYYPERLRILQKFHNRKYVYKTQYFNRKYEIKALSNIESEISNINKLLSF